MPTATEMYAYIQAYVKQFPTTEQFNAYSAIGMVTSIAIKLPARISPRSLKLAETRMVPITYKMLPTRAIIVCCSIMHTLYISAR